MITVTATNLDDLRRQVRRLLERAEPQVVFTQGAESNIPVAPRCAEGGICSLALGHTGPHVARVKDSGEKMQFSMRDSVQLDAIRKHLVYLGPKSVGAAQLPFINGWLDELRRLVG